ncbi:HNH endonuclease [Bacillus cereus]|uniref:HNH endonuclease n=1 Tax=Bacillus cereus TaxID=1396 RepID=UPI000BF9448D|nr:HNH endonuclease [Bacillus cereus]PES11083.1 HNH endonuclease [Bacillus cereus]PEX62963.1 HNH endonuclease [Bacillus cereus]PFL22825.1 HNH endonuclease [Bacillus cereus]PFR59929.1 HNH endonuclease [Bacillus cereus]PGW95240.1 HNH endonuclease [Bacillus cereus]
MILLERPSCPPELVLRKVELIEHYKLTKKPVWKKRFITDTLLTMSNDKCCFCECKLGEEGKYMQVDHFHHKADYEDEVVEWSNLLPICIRCNIHKRDHNTYENEIIDPTVRNPTDHLYLSKYRIKGKDNLGKLTVEVLDLNDTEEIAVSRFKIASAVLEKLDGILDLAEPYNPSTATALEKSRILRKVKSILKECSPKYSYSAVVSTVVLSSHVYDSLKSILVDKNLWTQEIQALEDVAIQLKFDEKP